MATPQAAVGAPGSGQLYPIVRGDARAERREHATETVPSMGGALLSYTVRTRRSEPATGCRWNEGSRPASGCLWNADGSSCGFQVIALVCFLLFGGLLPSGSGALLRWRSTDRDGWSPCSNECGPGVQVRRAQGGEAAKRWRAPLAAPRREGTRAGAPCARGGRHGAAARRRCHAHARRTRHWDARQFLGLAPQPHAHAAGAAAPAPLRAHRPATARRWEHCAAAPLLIRCAPDVVLTRTKFILLQTAADARDQQVRRYRGARVHGPRRNGV